jgi:predicted O-methyltransferase YrrM
MTQESWTAVDAYVHERLHLQDAALDHALASSRAAGLPEIAVSPTQGRLLQLLALALGARRILEVGTLGGTSAIWLARALPADGRLITLELDARHAEVARANLAHAGLAGVAEVRLGAAIESLPRIAAEGAGRFDLIFIDADKPSNPDYYEWGVRLTRPGGLILVDNVVREGSVIEAGSADASVQGVRRLFDRVHDDPRVAATAIQTVGVKGWDGLLIARRKDVS